MLHIINYFLTILIWLKIIKQNLPTYFRLFLNKMNNFLFFLNKFYPASTETFFLKKLFIYLKFHIRALISCLQTYIVWLSDKENKIRFRVQKWCRRFCNQLGCNEKRKMNNYPLATVADVRKKIEAVAIAVLAVFTQIWKSFGSTWCHGYSDMVLSFVKNWKLRIDSKNIQSYTMNKKGRF